VENGQLSSGILCCNEHHLLRDWYSAHIRRGGVAEGVDVLTNDGISSKVPFAEEGPP